MFKELLRFIKSLDFLKGTALAIAMIIPVLLSLYFLKDLNIGFSIALGVLFCSPADVAGSKKHIFFGIFIAIILSFCLTLFFGYISNTLWLLIPFLGFFVFGVSYLSVFGFRASLVSFAGLLAIILSFVNDYSEVNLITHSLLIGVGGIWYLSISFAVTLVFPKAETNNLFISILEKTAELLRVRGELLACKENRNDLFQKLFKLQASINEQHEIIRQIILSSRNRSGFSNRLRRQQLLFSELIDIFELTVANPLDYKKYDTFFKVHKGILVNFKNLTFEMAIHLEHISKVIRKEDKLFVNNKFPLFTSKIDEVIIEYRDDVGLPDSREGTIMLLNLKNYQEQQIQKIAGIERVFSNYSKNERIVPIKDAKKFITPQDYDFKKIKENFSLKSSIFRHSLRLTVIILVGFTIGNLFAVQNPYWILLTIVVIMRPSYGLTKARTIQRVIGTLIGGALATIIILLTSNTIVYGVLAIISLPLALSLLQLNYRNAAVFITINIVFVYAIFEPDILSVIQYRIIDTLIGSSLAIAANYLLWPNWEVQNIHQFFSNSIQSNQIFLKEISALYHTKEEVSTTYKLSRKDAFLSMGNLNAAFQRMNQDPKSKQSEKAIIYDLIVNCNTFLSSSTSLGSFIRNNKTSQVPEEFDVFIKNINVNLKLAIEMLEDKTFIIDENKSIINEASDSYDNFFEKLSIKRDAEIKGGNLGSVKLAVQLKETHLVSEQVKWLFNLSEKLVSSIRNYKKI